MDDNKGSGISRFLAINHSSVVSLEHTFVIQTSVRSAMFSSFPANATRTFSHTEDEHLFGWDPTPGIVSVWADRQGRAIVWRREDERVVPLGDGGPPLALWGARRA